MGHAQINHALCPNLTIFPFQAWRQLSAAPYEPASDARVLGREGGEG